MSLISDLAQVEDSPLTRPRFVETSFVFRNHYYVITDGIHFVYYPLRVEADASSPILRILKSPPVLLEGMAMVGNKVYLVPHADLVRRIIRKSREIQKEVNHASITTVPDILTSPGEDSLSSLVKSGVVDAFEMEVSQAADAAWQDQIGSLLDPFSEEEEEWEAADPT